MQGTRDDSRANASLEVRVVSDSDGLADFSALLSEYFDHLVVEWPDPDPVRWRREVDELPGKFGGPRGRMLVAYDMSEPVGIVALLDLGDGDCEVKRLYVRSGSRRQGVSRALMARALQEARSIGYRRMLLGTAPTFREALALYKSLGFEPTGRFRAGFTEDSVFMVSDLG